MLHSIVKKVKKRLHSGQRNAPAQPTPANPEETAKQEETSAEIAPPANRPQGGRKKKPSSRPRRKPKKPASAPETSPWDPTLFQVPAAKGKTRFQDLDLPDEILHAIYDLGFEYCTPIQAEILPPVLVGKDAFGKAQTGTGKSAAFLIAIFTRLMRHSVPQGTKNGQPRALILAPTRELVVQITRDAEDLGKYSPVNTLAVFGGIDYEKQKQALKQERIDVLIATPGRLLDYARRKVVRLDQVEILVIDEADRLLDMGFIPDVRQIINQTPYKDKRQTMLFSATLTPQIGHLAAQWTKEPVTVEIEPEQVAAESVEQIVYLATSEEKFTVLYNLITQKNLDRVIVFCNRKDVTRKVRDKLYQHGISCALLSGDVPQNKRMRTLDNFKNGKIRVLVATDVAGRGLHIEGISHVVNFNLPQDAEDYVHRIGRTGRAGATGTSVSFADEAESFYLPEIEEYMGQKLTCSYPEEGLLEPLPPPQFKKPESKRPPRPRGGRGRRAGDSSSRRPSRRGPAGRSARSRKPGQG